MRKHFSSLRSQMTLLTTGTVLAVVILATVFYSSAQRMSEKKAATFVHSMLVQLGDSLDRIGNEMSYLGSALHSNEVLQQYYHAPTAIQRMQYGKSFIDFTSSLLNHSTTVSHIVIVSSARRSGTSLRWTRWIPSITCLRATICLPVFTGQHSIPSRTSTFLHTFSRSTTPGRARASGRS